MKKILEITLGILTAIGGFVDIGDLVANAATGARFGFASAPGSCSSASAGIVVYAEMCGRVAAVSGRPVFEPRARAARPASGSRTSLASFFINFLTLRPSSRAWRSRSSWSRASTTCCSSRSSASRVARHLAHAVRAMEQVFGLAGLALLVFVVAVVAVRARLGRRAARGHPSADRRAARRPSPTPTSPSRCSARR